MAETENTAVTALIAELTGGGPRAVRGLAEPSAAGSLPENRAYTHERGPMQTSYPASMPVAAPFEIQRPAHSMPRAMLADTAALAEPTLVAAPPQMPAPPPPAVRQIAASPAVPVPAVRQTGPSAAVPVPAPIHRSAPNPVVVPPSAPAPAAASGWLVTPSGSIPVIPTLVVMPSGPAQAMSSEPAPAMPSALADSSGRGDPARVQAWKPPEQVWDFDGTQQLSKPSYLRVVVGRLVLPIAVLVVAGIVIGSMVLAPATSAPAVAPTSSPAPTSPPTSPAPRPAKSPAAPAFVEIRIDSQPSGATVTLIDRGKTQYVGNTPVNVAVDPSREYDLVVSHRDRPSHRQHLDPKSTRRVAVVLDDSP